MEVPLQREYSTLPGDMRLRRSLITYDAKSRPESATSQTVRQESGDLPPTLFWLRGGVRKRGEGSRKG